MLSEIYEFVSHIQDRGEKQNSICEDSKVFILQLA
jgi:hypothetical protein